MKYLLGCALLLACGPFAFGAAINQVSYDSLSSAFIVTFDDLPPAGVPGTNYDATTASQGVTFGERFAGQTLSASGNSDILDANALGPLTVVTGVSGQNVDLLTQSTNVIAGLGPLGYPDFDAIGEGALAFSFSNDQSQFGFQLVGGDGGDAFLSFFQRNGSLIQTIEVSGLSNDYYGFSRDLGVQDIAGVSIYNTDPGGIGLDNLKHDVVSVSETPEPAGYLLAGCGFVCLGALRLRNKARKR